MIIAVSSYKLAVLFIFPLQIYLGILFLHALQNRKALYDGHTTHKIVPPFVFKLPITHSLSTCGIFRRVILPQKLPASNVGSIYGKHIHCWVRPNLFVIFLFSLFVSFTFPVFYPGLPLL